MVPRRTAEPVGDDGVALKSDAQQRKEQCILQPDVRRQLAGFGIAFPEGTLPPISLREWSTWLTDSKNHAVARRVYARFGRINRAR